MRSLLIIKWQEHQELTEVDKKKVPYKHLFILL
jgi:hypothetical protein